MVLDGPQLEVHELANLPGISKSTPHHTLTEAPNVDKLYKRGMLQFLTIEKKESFATIKSSSYGDS